MIKKLFFIITVAVLIFPHGADAAYRKTKVSSGQRPGIESQIDWSNPLTKGLIGAWVFNESSGGVARNYALNKPDIVTNPNSPARSSYNGVGNAMRFNGSSTYMDIGYGSSGSLFKPTAPPLTILTKVYCTAGGGVRREIISTEESTASGYEMSWRNTGVGYTFEFGVFGGTYWVASQTSGAGYDILPSKWLTLCGVWQRSGVLKIYDNSLVSSTGNTATSATYGSRTVNIGRAAGGVNYFSDAMEYLFVWREQLSDTAIRSLYKNPYQIFKPQSRRIVSESGAAPSSAIKTINGLAKASTKTVNGLANASIKTWNGLA